ncbi:MAG TPA: response regulator [Isosphaeraceae bacterium]|nr:response regulator [Isosphaeraceae bacterium]
MALLLVVDEDAQLRQMLRVIFEEVGHQVTEAASETEAIRLYQRQPADLVLCDVPHPEKPTLAIVEKLRPQFPQLKVLAMSGGIPPCGPNTQVRLAAQLGTQGVLAKPFALATLLALVAATLKDGRG